MIMLCGDEVGRELLVCVSYLVASIFLLFGIEVGHRLLDDEVGHKLLERVCLHA